ncbi:hypothetical protein [Bacillus amyloliquefaciens]|uniref:hypothetical protein n=1 Tax=Bacillus amyloliquefaciens TaxID=1390 RepID=UPI00073BAF43|nr:hypothetical protein [Bacillus amyloliquefaciens]KTF58635.1 hypothetical protein AR691_20060 [Bacillus amyloliquefaciens]
MVNKFFDVIAGIGILIGIYLFLKNAKSTTSIISTIASNSISGIKVLQGREMRHDGRLSPSKPGSCSSGTFTFKWKYLTRSSALGTLKNCARHMPTSFTRWFRKEALIDKVTNMSIEKATVDLNGNQVDGRKLLQIIIILVIR